MARMVTHVQEAAQRRVIGVVRLSGVLSGGGLAVWREYVPVQGAGSAAELSQDLDALGVDHHIVMAYRPPRGREIQTHEGQEVRIASTRLPRLVRWVPSLRQPIDELPADAPGFTFAYFEPKIDGLAMRTVSSFAAEWPSWTLRQAAAMGLLCARCSFDLRTPGPGRRPAYNIPAEPERLRLLCGTCCGDGLAELERLTASGERG